jgi:3-hydroxyisobutyrate dehydrogenase-like beta-hydroxyacid dehydrogenase
MASTCVGILSPGDMGHAVGALLAERGFRLVSALAGRSELTRRRALRAGIEDAGDLEGVVGAADGILAILPPAEAERLAGRVAEAMRRSGRTPIYADCNAVSPATARRIAEAFTAVGAPFIDAGIIGAAPGPKRPDTRFYASGPESKWLEGLAGRGKQGGITVVGLGEETGKASAIKMAYAALTKGTMTLQAAVLMTAMRLGVFEELGREFEKSQPEAWARMRVLPFLPADSGRWIGEMEQIAATFRGVGVPDDFHRGAAAIFAIMAATPFAAESRESLDRSRGLEEAIRAFVEQLPAGQEDGPASDA